jgi:hypothetical protein
MASAATQKRATQRRRPVPGVWLLEVRARGGRSLPAAASLRDGSEYQKEIGAELGPGCTSGATGIRD